MQPFGNLAGIMGHIRCHAKDVKNQIRFHIHADMRLNFKEILITLMRWSALLEKPSESRLTGFLSLPKEDLS